jgi:hypothetical protein
MSTKKAIFTKKEINAYEKAYADLKKRYQEGDLKGNYDLYREIEKSIDSTIKNVSLMRERKCYIDLIDAFTIAVGIRMREKIKYLQVYSMNEKDYSLFAQYNSLGARRALHTLLKSLVDDADPTSVRKKKGIPHNVSFTGFSKIMLGTGKEFSKEAKAYGAGTFNTDYLWYNDDGSTFRWKTDEVKNLCEMILTSRAAEAYASVTDLSSDVYDLLYNEPDFIEFITKINDDIEIVELKENKKKKDVSYQSTFAAVKNTRDVDQINLMLKELESRGLGKEPIHSPHVRQTKERVPKEFKEGDVILKSHIVDLKPLLPVLIDMPFTKRVFDKKGERKETQTNAKIVVFAINSKEFIFGFYHEEFVKVPGYSDRHKEHEFLVGSTYLGTIDKNIKQKQCEIEFRIMPMPVK